MQGRVTWSPGISGFSDTEVGKQESWRIFQEDFHWGEDGVELAAFQCQSYHRLNGTSLKVDQTIVFPIARKHPVLFWFVADLWWNLKQSLTTNSSGSRMVTVELSKKSIKRNKTNQIEELLKKNLGYSYWAIPISMQLAGSNKPGAY